MKTYSVVEINFVNQSKLVEEIKSFAVAKFSCDGMEEFSLQEKEIDGLLGKEAICGGEIHQAIIDKVDNLVSKNKRIFKFFFSKENGIAFGQYLQNNFSQLNFLVREEEVQDWGESWKQHFKPIHVSERIDIIPAWEKKEKKGIYIYPGMGFGTGGHETTFLCLTALDNLREKVKKNGHILDFGCGSGILGIGAIKLLQGRVDFCDVDKDALDNCLQNLILNFKEHELNGHGLILRERFHVNVKYDLVFANILEHILIHEKDILIEAVLPGGYLIISGILFDQTESIKATFSQFKFVEEMAKGDWRAIVFKRGEQ